MRGGESLFVTCEERVVFFGGDLRARGESFFKVLRAGERDRRLGANGVSVFRRDCDAVEVWSDGSSVRVWERSVRYDEL